MIRLFLLLTIIFVFAILIIELKKFLLRDAKLEELKEVIIEGEVVDLDNDIAAEKARQKDVADKSRKMNS